MICTNPDPELVLKPDVLIQMIGRAERTDFTKEKVLYMLMKVKCEDFAEFHDALCQREQQEIKEASKKKEEKEEKPQKGFGDAATNEETATVKNEEYPAIGELSPHKVDSEPPSFNGDVIVHEDSQNVIRQRNLSFKEDVDTKKQTIEVQKKQLSFKKDENG